MAIISSDAAHSSSYSITLVIKLVTKTHRRYGEARFWSLFVFVLLSELLRASTGFKECANSLAGASLELREVLFCFIHDIVYEMLGLQRDGHFAVHS